MTGMDREDWTVPRPRTWADSPRLDDWNQSWLDVLIWAWFRWHQGIVDPFEVSA